MKHIGYMRRIPQEGAFSNAKHHKATVELACSIFGVQSSDIAIGEAHGIVGFLFPNMLEILAQPKD